MAVAIVVDHDPAGVRVTQRLTLQFGHSPNKHHPGNGSWTGCSVRQCVVSRRDNDEEKWTIARVRVRLVRKEYFEKPNPDDGTPTRSTWAGSLRF